MDGSQEELNLEFNIIDNIIGSAVDDLLLKDNSSVQYDYNMLLPVLLPLCRFCARENPQMMHISDVHQQIINDLRIPVIHGASVCTNICGSCNRFLEEFCKFRSVCEEGQKRIATLLSGPHVLPNFLQADFTVGRRDLLPVQVNESYERNVLSAIGNVQSSSEYIVSETMMDSSNLKLTTCEQPNCTEDRTPITLPLSVIQRPDSHRTSDTDQYINRDTEFDSNQTSDRGNAVYESNVCKNIEICDETNTGELVENVEQKSKNKAVERKKSAKTEARRRVVDGRLEWVCLDCEQVFGSCLQLKKHRRSCELVGSKTSKRFAALGCDICGETMSTESALTMHRRKHETKVKRSAALKTLSSTNLEPIICDVCGHASKSKRALRLHRITHSSEKQVECHICGKRFKRRRTLRIHLEVHSGRKYECEVCGKQFLTSVTLRNHAKTHRYGNVRHDCTVCQRQFAHANQLQKHMMTHTGEFPYVCEICNAMFRTLGRYNRHMQKGHVLPPGLHVIEQTETNSWDDLIEYQPELMINDTLDEAASEMMLAMGESTSDSSLLSDQLINQAPGEFVVQCGETAERFMPFLECS